MKKKAFLYILILLSIISTTSFLRATELEKELKLSKRHKNKQKILLGFTPETMINITSYLNLEELNVLNKISKEFHKIFSCNSPIQIGTRIYLRWYLKHENKEDFIKHLLKANSQQTDSKICNSWTPISFFLSEAKTLQKSKNKSAKIAEIIADFSLWRTLVNKAKEEKNKTSLNISPSIEQEIEKNLGKDNLEKAKLNFLSKYNKSQSNQASLEESLRGQKEQVITEIIEQNWQHFWDEKFSPSIKKENNILILLQIQIFSKKSDKYKTFIHEFSKEILKIEGFNEINQQEFLDKIQKKILSCIFKEDKKIISLKAVPQI